MPFMNMNPKLCDNMIFKTLHILQNCVLNVTELMGKNVENNFSKPVQLYNQSSNKSNNWYLH